MAMLKVRSIEEIKAYDIYPDVCPNFCSEISARYDIDCVPAKNSKEALAGSDIVVTATTSKTAVFDG
jgi:ornithine cyclodeaminase/alanine dehydrogenase-like protein (mu-crystallin family)